jgi:hypothetical protein
MSSTLEIQSLKAPQLAKAFNHSWYLISGTGGDLSEWVSGYEGLLAEKEIGKPKFWATTDGASINAFAQSRLGSEITPSDRHPDDTVFLLFPLDGLDIAKLALFKIRTDDRWFDDVIQNVKGV